MRKHFSIPTAALTLSLAISLAGCAHPGGAAISKHVAPAAPSPLTTHPGAVVNLGPANFIQTSVTLHAGQAVRFVDPMTSGGPHMLCLGHNQICDSATPGPAALRGAGFRIMPGAPNMDVVFSTPGTYEITCSLHPLMNLRVIVR